MKDKELSYTEAMDEIERILARFEDAKMDVDSLAAEVGRATELLAFCRSRLLKAEEDVNRILSPES